MVTRADLNSNRPLSQIDASLPAGSATDPRREAVQRLSQLTVGKALVAHVLAALDDGAHLVRVADATVRMALPQGTRAGDTLALTYVSKEPRPTFLLDASRGGSAPASLSQAGRMIDLLLQSARHSSATPQIAGATPLLPAAGMPDAASLSTALQDSLTHSGLFYESHLQEWVAGSRPLAELAREPQAQLAARMQDTPAADARARLSPDPAAAQMPSTPTVDADLLLPAQPQQPALAPEVAGIVSQQLHVLEHQHLRWQGELMPGQPMEWEVSHDAPDGGGNAPEQQVWTSVVRFDLPTLGAVSGTVRLSGGRVHVQIGAASEEAAQSMRAFSARLSDALDAAGAPLDSFLVKQNG
jgi:hypothetical protein